MAEVQQQQTTGKSRRRSRRPFPSVRVDMTPMVDLAFLLLTFFVLTSELSKQNAITAKFPAGNTDDKMPVQGMTVFLGQNPEKIFWSRGEISPSAHLNVTGSPKNGLLSVLKNANVPVFEQVEIINRQHNLGLLNDASWTKKNKELMDSKTIPFVVIKWDENASYASVIKVIDALNRTHNNRYAVVPMSDDDKLLVAQQEK